MVSLMDGDCGVHNVRCNGLLLDDGLDVLVNVVVNSLTSDSGSHSSSVCGIVGSGCAGKVGTLLVKLGSDLLGVAMVELLVHYRGDVVRAGFRAERC